MTQVKMPEPVAFRWRVPIVDSEGRQYGESGWKIGAEKGGLPWWTQDSLITTTQAEAYADARVREAQQWNLIDSAPHETLVVLGWYDESGVFKQEIGLASAGRRYPGGASDMWWHGQATHWLPLPTPPLPGTSNSPQ